MAPHEEFLELCAAATAGELASDEQARLDAHLEGCAKCQRTMKEYEVAAQHGAALASKFATEQNETDRSWSVEEAEKAFFKRLENENRSPRAAAEGCGETSKRGRRFDYRPLRIHWLEIWLSLAAILFLALALTITSYRTGVKRKTDSARTTKEPAKESTSLEEQASDAGREYSQLLTKLGEEDRVIADLKRQLMQQRAVVTALKAKATLGSHQSSEQQSTDASSQAGGQRDEELAAAQAKVLELQIAIKTLTGKRDEVTSDAAALEAKVGQLTQLVLDSEHELEQRKEQVAKDRYLLDRDHDIRELIGARELYIAEIHDVSSAGETNRTYGRIFYTRGKRLVFYAYDLDAQQRVQDVSTFQAWGRRGPDKQQALNLGILYEDNVSKKRWVLRVDDPKSLEEIDAIFVTVEPNGGSPYPSGKQLLFACLRISPNHP